MRRPTLHPCWKSSFQYDITHAGPVFDSDSATAGWGNAMAEAKNHRKGEAFKYIHNDLMQGAHFFRWICVEKEKAGNRHGIAWDYTACMLFIAFGFEACINFIGVLKVQGWVERQSFDKKIKQVTAVLGINPDWNKRPYSSMQHAKDFRD